MCAAGRFLRKDPSENGKVKRCSLTVWLLPPRLGRGTAQIFSRHSDDRPSREHCREAPCRRFPSALVLDSPNIQNTRPAFPASENNWRTSRQKAPHPFQKECDPDNPEKTCGPA